jgi:predicted transcriptional regulator
MANDEQTTVMIDMETDRKLKRIAKALERSKAAQIRYWVNREYAELDGLKLLPAEDESGPKPLAE